MDMPREQTHSAPREAMDQYHDDDQESPDGAGGKWNSWQHCERSELRENNSLTELTLNPTTSYCKIIYVFETFHDCLTSFIEEGLNIVTDLTVQV